MNDSYKYINLSYLNSITDNDIDLIKELITIFIDQVPEFKDGLSDGYKNKDWKKIAAVAHKAKSSVISMGMNDLGNKDLKNLELIAKLNMISELEKNSPGDEKLVQLQKTLDSYSEERRNWLNENNNDETVNSIINHFNSTCEAAIIELNSILEN